MADASADSFVPRYGMGVVTFDGYVTLDKSFTRSDKNASKVDDFVEILVTLGHYRRGNSEIELSYEMIPALIEAFSEHEGTLAFLEKLLNDYDDGAFIVIMVEKPREKTPIQIALMAAEKEK